MKQGKLYTIAIIFLTICIFMISITDKPEDNNRQNTILFLGDSLTYNYKINEFFEGYKTFNSGISGNKTTDILNDLENRVYKYNSTKVFLLIGINDLKNGISNDEVLNNIEIIIKKIKENSKDTIIYVESLYPVSDEKDKKNIKKIVPKTDNNEIKETNKKLNELCKKYNIKYINVYDKLLNDKGSLKKDYTTDGLHLNDLGYFKVTKVLEKYVSEKES